MKKFIIFIAISVFTYSTAQSQEFRLGAKVGVNFASIGGDGAENLDPRLGFHLGGLVEIPLVGKFALQPEILYSSQGTKQGYYNIIFDSNIKSNLKLDYINIPVMGKYYIIEGLSVELGPQIGFLVSAKDKYKNHDDTGNDNVKDSYRSVVFAVGIGASYRLDSGVFFSLRFNKGISQINENLDYIHPHDYPGNYNYSYKQQNNVLQLSAGYSF